MRTGRRCGRLGGMRLADLAKAVPGSSHERRTVHRRVLRQAGSRCFESGARVFELESGVMARVAGTVSPQPLMAVVPVPVHDLGSVRAGAPRLVVVCVDVRDPGNAGTVVRSAWAAGVDAVICCEGTVDMWNPKAVRSSAGAVLHVPVVQGGSPADVLTELGEWGLVRWGTAVDTGTDYACADLAQPCALVVGNEAGGLPVDDMAGFLDGILNIPMPGGAESLNVGMAAAVICFEAARQRRLGHGGVGSPASFAGPGKEAS
jgi:TrmH family RNA methyltransferase